MISPCLCIFHDYFYLTDSVTTVRLQDGRQLPLVCTMLSICWYIDLCWSGYTCSAGGSRRPSQASMASSSGDLREGRVHHYLYMRAPNYSLTSETNTTTTGTSDSSPRTPKSTEQLLAVYHSVPEVIYGILTILVKEHGIPDFVT